MRIFRGSRGLDNAMRSTAAVVAALFTLALVPAAGAHSRHRPSRARSASAVASMSRSLSLGMRQAGSYSGTKVVDLTTGRTLYAHHARTRRLPASVEKLYTTATALQRFGPDATLSTTILGRGHMQGHRFVGTLYLRGGGDPTFGAASFDAANYGTGATMEQLVANLRAATGIQALDGNIVADQSVFDGDRGTPATRNRPSTEVEGELSGLSFDRGWYNLSGTVLDAHPARDAGLELASTLKAAGVKVPRHTRVTGGRTPAGATSLASVASPTMATLLGLTNAPSDNFFAEMLLKDLGARFGAGGTTAAGAGVVRSEMAGRFHIHPRLNDGSGLSRYDRTTPAQVVTLLRRMAGNPAFTASLAVAGRTGTLRHEMRRTYAAGRCRGKTGTLHDVSNLVGYCRARDGHTLAFAVMMNGVYPDAAHPIQNRMVISVARYDG